MSNTHAIIISALNYFSSNINLLNNVLKKKVFIVRLKKIKIYIFSMKSKIKSVNQCVYTCNGKR